jgi:hypothetical protein
MRQAVKEEMTMNTKTLATFFVGFFLLVACNRPAVQPTPTLSVTPTLFIIPQTTVQPSTGVTPAPGTTALPGISTICTDPQVSALIDSLKKAFLTSDGTLLSSLVSPTRGMDVAFFRNGTVINYDPPHAKFLFETTYPADWGTEPGSGAAKKGPFHDVVAPELVKIFNQPYTLHCNELAHGGATYELRWPYQGEFYSVHFPGTQANSNMDWRTWAIGIEYVSGKPYIYALMQFFWEP